MRTYRFRVRERATLIQGLADLRILREIDPGEFHPIDVRTVYIERGTLYEGTGQFTESEYGPIEQMAPIVADDGQPYFHADLLFPGELEPYAVAEFQAATAAGETERAARIAELLAHRSEFFPTDELGQPKAPANPQFGFAGCS